MDAVRARFRGCLLGGGAGDAVAHDGACHADTMATLATAEGLLLGWDDSDKLGSACLVASVRRAAHSRTGLSANGRLAGVAPVGLFMWRPDGAFSIRPAFALATELAGGRPSAGALASIIAGLADGMALPGAVAIARHLLGHLPDHGTALQALNRAEAYARAGIDPAQAIGELGLKCGADQPLAIAVYCALVSGSFADGLALAKKHGDRAESVPALTGQLLGALHGADAIPPHWLERVAQRDALAGIADRLATYWRGS